MHKRLTCQDIPFEEMRYLQFRYNGPELTQYTGFITVNEKNNRNLFYWFIESQNNPDSDPLVVWYQGGPGCSGLFGLFVENGPFVPSITFKFSNLN